MKQLTLGIVLSVIAVFITAIILTINTRSSREQELQASVDAALSATLDKASLDAVSGEYSDEGMASLAKEAIKKNITVPENDKNFALDIDIIKADAKNGLLSANVKETYSNPNGMPITIETTRTIALEGENDKETYCVSYKYTKEDSKEFGVPELAAEYTVFEGDGIPVPKTSRFSGFSFKGFYDKDADIQYTADDLKAKSIDDFHGSKTFYLNYQSDGSTENTGKLITVRMKPAFSPGSSTDISTGGTEGSGTGTYYYYFGYDYCTEHKAIELEILIKDKNKNTHFTYRFHSADDHFQPNTSGPSLLGNKTLDKAIAEMISDLKITDYDVQGIKNLITAKYKFSEDRKHIWYYKLPNKKNFYLTFVTADSLTIVNTDATLTVKAGKGIDTTYGSGTYPKGTTVKYGGTAHYGYKAEPEKEILLKEDTTVTVGADPWKHTIHFDSNGGDYPPPDMDKIYGTALYIPALVPDRPGFHFDGWHKSNSTTYYPGDNYTDDQDGGTVTLIAQWKSAISYDTVLGLNGLVDTLNVNGFADDAILNGKAIVVEKKPAVTYQGMDVSQSIIFIGWNTDPSGNGDWYAYNENGSSGVFTYSGGDVRLYAQYRLKYTIFYDGNEQTEGDNFFVSLEDSNVSATSGTTFSFSENPFSKYEEKTVFDKNLNENITVTEKYSFQGWSLDKNAYFNDARVYYCPNENRDEGFIEDAGMRSYLSECLINNPCDNIQVSDSYITITTYAVWDKYPEIYGNNIGLIKEQIEKLSDDELKKLILDKSVKKTFDREDSPRFDKNPSANILNFQKEDYIPKGDFGTSVCTIIAKDNAGNISYDQIKVFVTTENFETSRGDGSKNTSMYKRFIDEENFSRSFSSYNTQSESMLDVTGRKKAHADGGMEAYSKWLLSDECREEMKKTLAS